MKDLKHELNTGLDVLVKEGFKRLLGQKVAILANQASVDKNIDHIVALALKHGLTIVKLFAPEHGFSGIAQDMEKVGESFDNALKIPIISLYGDHKESLKLKARHLADVDILLCDLQDIGSRYYTFHCTIAWAMAACQESGTKLMLIDRPNPINASTIEGNLVKKANFSFVGAYPLPNRHGFSMGELVTYVKTIWDLSFELEIIEMQNYQRELYFDDLALPYVSPSPNMPSVNACVVYPGLCLLEGTNLSEGRGTCTPFEIFGAPYISSAEDFKNKIDSFELKGVKTRAVSFRPQFQKHAQKDCLGVFVHVTDRALFQPLRFALAVIKSAMTYPGFDWRREAYEFEHERLAIDLLLGDEKMRLMLEKGASFKELEDKLRPEEDAFRKQRKNFLQYK